MKKASDISKIEDSRILDKLLEKLKMRLVMQKTI